MEPAVGDMIDENERESRFPVNPQPDDFQIGVEVSEHVVVANAKHEGECEPGLEEGQIIGGLQLEEGKSLSPKDEEKAGAEEVPKRPYQEDPPKRLIVHARASCVTANL